MGGRGRRHGREERQLILDAIEQARSGGSRLASACRMLGLSARTIERWQSKAGGDLRCGPKHAPSNSLNALEVAAVLALLTAPGNAGISPKELVPRLADAGTYLASESTIYRLKRRLGLNRPRRPADPTGVKRSSVAHSATGPNQVWSWDITYLPTTVRGRFLYLYLVLDVWSRRIVGWRIHSRESASHAADLMRDICAEAAIDTTGLILHSDNGKPMRGSTMLSMLQSLGIVPSFSRPHVSNDNPYSESLFRTIKHTPAYPGLPFNDVLEAQAWTARFVDWYNREHRHSGIRFVTPDQRHSGEHTQILSKRHALYERARMKHPSRWSRQTRNWEPIPLVTLNPLLTPAVASAA